VTNDVRDPLGNVLAKEFLGNELVAATGKPYDAHAFGDLLGGGLAFESTSEDVDAKTHPAKALGQFENVNDLPPRVGLAQFGLG